MKTLTTVLILFGIISTCAAQSPSQEKNYKIRYGMDLGCLSNFEQNGLTNKGITPKTLGVLLQGYVQIEHINGMYIQIGTGFSAFESYSPEEYIADKKFGWSKKLEIGYISHYNQIGFGFGMQTMNGIDFVPYCKIGRPLAARTSVFIGFSAIGGTSGVSILF